MVEAVAHDVIHFVFEVEQILDHRLVLFGIDDDGAALFL